jgi:hypothetical protein
VTRGPVGGTGLPAHGTFCPYGYLGGSALPSHDATVPSALSIRSQRCACWTINKRSETSSQPEETSHGPEESKFTICVLELKHRRSHSMR